MREKIRTGKINFITKKVLYDQLNSSKFSQISRATKKSIYFLKTCDIFHFKSKQKQQEM